MKFCALETVCECLCSVTAWSGTNIFNVNWFRLNVGVKRAHRSVRVYVDLVRLVDEHVDKTCLAMMKVSHNSDVAHHFSIRSQTEHEPEKPTSTRSASIPRPPAQKQLLLLMSHALVLESLLRSFAHADPELADFDGLDNGLGEGLRVFFLYHRFDTFSIYG